MSDQFTPQEPSRPSAQPGPGQRPAGGPSGADHRWRLGGRSRRGTGVLARGTDDLIAHLPEEQQDADEAARLVREAGRTCVTVPGDILDEEHCQELARAGQPVEVAAAFVFLASAESSYVTGERIGVHGGMALS